MRAPDLVEPHLQLVRQNVGDSDGLVDDEDLFVLEVGLVYFGVVLLQLLAVLDYLDEGPLGVFTLFVLDLVVHVGDLVLDEEGLVDEVVVGRVAEETCLLDLDLEVGLGEGGEWDVLLL